MWNEVDCGSLFIDTYLENGARVKQLLLNNPSAELRAY